MGNGEKSIFILGMVHYQGASKCFRNVKLSATLPVLWKWQDVRFYRFETDLGSDYPKFVWQYITICHAVSYVTLLTSLEVWQNIYFVADPLSPSAKNLSNETEINSNNDLFKALIRMESSGVGL